MEQIRPQEFPSWQKFILEFDTAKKQFDDNYRGLLFQRSYIEEKHPELLNDYQNMVVNASKHAKTLDNLQRIRNIAFAAIRTFTPGLGGLGALPVIIGVGAAAASLAVIIKFLKDMYIFSKKVNEMKRLEAAGHTPAQASAIVNKLGEGGGSGFVRVGNMLLLIAVAGAALFILPPLLKRR